LSPAASTSAYTKIYRAVKRIPRGRVATYGQIARIAGLPGRARQVGYALHAANDEDPVPWHRVVDAQGRIKPRSVPGAAEVQAVLLRREGVALGRSGRVDLTRYGWRT
jgi:methylated-DNA-protein-cysteine methyltransferase-like protein